MPEMDGLQTLAALRKTHPLLPVLMFSRFTQRGATATLDALALGATDCVAKPAADAGPDQAFAYIQATLIPKIKRICGRGSRSSASGVIPSHSRPRSATAENRPPWRPEVLAIATSTGGPNILAGLIAALPADFPLPVLVVQHMPPLFTRLL